ncbi:hypothetical protein NDU88_004733 [Pleurodeles waltl]|uniref:Uncharacterized protein n=1 Tax=Pleurodeles waltl TaxID=8319 RepID=A0AAV7UG11_PLEWA|nr:hypothetical protein NDU88_004733 [Pleurodeles waltl]
MGAGDARESGRTRGHEAAQWRHPGGLSPWKKKSGVPQSGGSGGPSDNGVFGSQKLEEKKKKKSQAIQCP